MLSQRTEFPPRAVRWLGPATLLALAPKCVVCVLAYAGLGAALGWSGPELCGEPTGESGSWSSMLALLGITSGLAAGCFLASRRRAQPAVQPDQVAVSEGDRR